MVKLQEMGEFVRSASSTIEAPVVRRLKEAFGPEAAGRAQGGAGPAATSAPQAAPPKEARQRQVPVAAAPSAGNGQPRGRTAEGPAAGRGPAVPRPAPPGSRRPAGSGPAGPAGPVAPSAPDGAPRQEPQERPGDHDGHEETAAPRRPVPPVPSP